MYGSQKREKKNDHLDFVQSIRHPCILRVQVFQEATVKYLHSVIRFGEITSNGFFDGLQNAPCENV